MLRSENMLPSKTLTSKYYKLIFNRIATRYAAGCPGRKKQIIVQEGSEPISFRGYFQAWQEDYDPKAKFDSMQQNI